MSSVRTPDSKIVKEHIDTYHHDQTVVSPATEVKYRQTINNDDVDFNIYAEGGSNDD